jgi:O-methyltransferase
MSITVTVRNFVGKFRRLMIDTDRRRHLALYYLCAVPFRLRLRHLWPGTYMSHIPDRYSVNRHRYRAQGGAGKPWETTDFLRRNAVNNGGDLTRWYFLHLVCDQILAGELDGDVAELGVYKGNTAALLARLARRLGRTAYLLDTFSGFSTDDLAGIDAKERMAFADTSLPAVRALVGDEATVFVQGSFPASAAQLPATAAFILTHLDCDLYAPMRAGLDYFYPRTKPGGFIIVHDYSSLRWPGSKQAVDEFLADKPERIVPIPDKSGTAVIRRHIQTGDL